MHINQKISDQVFNEEFDFIFSRSSGPGGQNVNKVNTKVTLKFNIPDSTHLSEDEKAILFKKLESKLDSSGTLIIHCQERRSQIQNKELAIQKFYDLLKKAFEKKKIRKVTKPSKASIDKRLKDKREHALKKQQRKADW